MRKIEVHAEAPPVGYIDYLTWLQGKTTQWAWLAIRAELEAVEEFYRRLDWQVGPALSRLPADSAYSNTVTVLVQPYGKSYEWVLTMYGWDNIDRSVLAQQAQQASQELTTKAFWTTTIGSAITYELLDWGKRQEYAQVNDTFTFTSLLRQTPKENFLEGEMIEGLPKFQLLIDENLGDLFVYLYPCVGVKTADGYAYLLGDNCRAPIAQVKLLTPKA
ncbi:MAG: hypothetical protein RMK91_05235 [Pseudanabaenaceae cyanobacterium SKYGB_i_bin29]|nr:hypothetical protein [Pseudanabaenaceae cyanobacterium SKYG29]MDW8421251.1 hypothetical protein [Pseudanabaenaceae cyanobacterium SKYGB_i_bin29]